MTKQEVYLYLYTHAPQPPMIGFNHPSVVLSPGVRARAMRHMAPADGLPQQLREEWLQAGAPTYPQFDREPEGPRREAYNVAYWARTHAEAVLEVAQEAVAAAWPKTYADRHVEAAWAAVEALV